MPGRRQAVEGWNQPLEPSPAQRAVWREVFNDLKLSIILQKIQFGKLINLTACPRAAIELCFGDDGRMPQRASQRRSPDGVGTGRRGK
jgi:hypothetical protein